MIGGANVIELRGKIMRRIFPPELITAISTAGNVDIAIITAVADQILEGWSQVNWTAQGVETSRRDLALAVARCALERFPFIQAHNRRT
jgi:hypothetical protein